MHHLVLAALAAASVPSGEARFRALYKELVETNTTLSAGSCTLAAERMAARLKAAGFAGGAPEGGRLARRRAASVRRARPSQGGRPRGRLSGARSPEEGRAPARAHRR